MLHRGLTRVFMGRVFKGRPTTKKARKHALALSSKKQAKRKSFYMKTLAKKEASRKA